jgi:hypothetical protein
VGLPDDDGIAAQERKVGEVAEDGHAWSSVRKNRSSSITQRADKLQIMVSKRTLNPFPEECGGGGGTHPLGHRMPRRCAIAPCESLVAAAAAAAVPTAAAGDET